MNINESFLYTSSLSFVIIIIFDISKSNHDHGNHHDHDNHHDYDTDNDDDRDHDNDSKTEDND